MKTLKISSLFLLLSVLFFSCQKEYSLEGIVTPAGTWQFNDDTKLYAGNIDTAFIETTGTTKTLNLIGKSSDGSQNFLLHLYATDSFTLGTYKASLFQSDFQYYTQAKTIYQADQFIGEFIVTITALGNNSITGIFAGASEDSTGAVKPLTLGKFTSRLNLFGNGTGGTGTATGTLGAASGVCTPISTSGTYTQGVALTSTNTATAQVNVTTPGTYTISTNTVNGVTFSGTGTFSTTGAQNVILTGTGLPTNSGNQSYTVTFGTSTCTFVVNYATGVAPATGSLGGAPSTCTPVTPAGTYTQGTALTSGNTITIQVNVTTAGSYNITTSTVNGVSFSKSGTFASTGVQSVTLTGTGTPTGSGSQTFTVTFGSSTCTFTINFAASAVDYFPTTLNSFWVYGLQGGTPADSFMTKVSPVTKSIGGNSYTAFTLDDVPPSGSPDSLFYRKAAGLYYENFNTEDFFGFDPGTGGNVEYKFLDETLPVNSTWNSPNMTGMSGGSSYTIFIKMTLFAKVTTATQVGVVNSSDILKVRYEYFVSIAPGIPFFVEERWFAKGIGMVYNSFNDGSTTDVYQVGRYQVF